MASRTVVRPKNRRQLVCSTCGEHGFDADYEFADEEGWVCTACGSNNYYPEVQAPALVCSHCGHDDLVGPFEMDGYEQGVYRTTGQWWVVCRGCNRSSGIDRGLLPTGTKTRHGVIVCSTLTAYEMDNGTFASFDVVHGRPLPVTPLVVVR